MYKRVLLVFPDYKGGHYGALRPPAGLGYIAEILEKSNIKYDVVDMAAGFSTKKLKRTGNKGSTRCVYLTLRSKNQL